MKEENLIKIKDISKSLQVHKKSQKGIVECLCKDLSEEEKIKEWLDALAEFQEAYGKVLYSELSSYIIDEFNGEYIEILENNIENISEHIDVVQKEGGINLEQYRFWLKFRDHCKLAILQRSHYNVSKKNIEDLTDSIIKEETNRIQKEITGQLIGLVSIFTALSFVIFGGINILSSILENVRIATVSRLICVGLLWTISMSFLFYIFISFILKILYPKETSVFDEKFMKCFRTLMSILIILLVLFIVLSFICPRLFAII